MLRRCYVRQVQVIRGRVANMSVNPTKLCAAVKLFPHLTRRLKWSRAAAGHTTGRKPGTVPSCGRVARLALVHVTETAHHFPELRPRRAP